MTTTTTPDANSVLMGQGGAPACKFDEPGTTWEGQIVTPPEAHQIRDFDPNNPGAGALKFFPSGDPIMGVTVDIQTTHRDPLIDEDDGVRRVYLDGRYNKEAVRNAVKASGANGLEVGGHLRITFTRREDPMDKRSRKYWDVTYTPAGNAALMGGQDRASGHVPAQQGNGGQPATPTPTDTAKQLIAAGLADEQIVAITGLTQVVVAAMRSYGEPPF